MKQKKKKKNKVTRKPVYIEINKKKNQYIGDAILIDGVVDGLEIIEFKKPISNGVKITHTIIKVIK